MTTLPHRPADAVVGQEIPHESAALHVTGQALYTDDLVGRTRVVLHAHPVQAPHAHARVTGLRTAPALRVPGVVRVLTADDVPGVNDAGVKHDEPLFPTEVMFHGHAVCWVLGETLEAARLGALAVEVDYEPLPAIVTVREAIDGRELPGRPPDDGARRRRRGVRRGAPTCSAASSTSPARSTSTSRRTRRSPRSTRPGRCSSSAAPSTPPRPRTSSPTSSACPSHAVTVQCLRMGGGFGGKEMQPHGFAAIAALGARLTGRPVRLRLTRSQDMTMTGKRHGFHAQWRVAFEDDGALRALDATLTSDGGWSLDLSEPVLARALCHVDNAYWIPHVRVARPDRPDPQDVPDRVPRVRRPAGDARHRGRPRPVRPAARDRPRRPAAPQLLRRGPDHALRTAGPPPRADGDLLGPGAWPRPTSSPGARRSPRGTPGTSTRSGPWP